jgi:hypothetical protein
LQAGRSIHLDGRKSARVPAAASAFRGPCLANCRGRGVGASPQSGVPQTTVGRHQPSHASPNTLATLKAGIVIFFPPPPSD